LEELAGVAKPDTLLVWHRKLTASKFDASRFRRRVGRPRIDKERERLVLQIAKENPSWGCDRTVGALANLGFLAAPLHGSGLDRAENASGYPASEVLRNVNSRQVFAALRRTRIVLPSNREELSGIVGSRGQANR
jgi:hypothetical protein